MIRATRPPFETLNRRDHDTLEEMHGIGILGQELIFE
ncbi:hypothetical protein CGLAMM_04550 [Acetobacteraceae bacterium EV16G]|uniref:Uncharacterized protein n=1 Tax=Sorlinia euscelidii TaxID=3081148 RepID=A0ABU7U1D0_9PROT